NPVERLRVRGLALRGIGVVDPPMAERALVDHLAVPDRGNRKARKRHFRIVHYGRELRIERGVSRELGGGKGKREAHGERGREAPQGFTSTSRIAAVSASGMPSNFAGRYFIWKTVSTRTVCWSSSPFMGTA